MTKKAVNRSNLDWELTMIATQKPSIKQLDARIRWTANYSKRTLKVTIIKLSHIRCEIVAYEHMEMN